MNKNHIFIKLLLIGFASVWLGFYPQEKDEKDFLQKMKIVLRDVGNQLLLINKDSTSLILPIKEIEQNNFEISFENELSFEPSMLVNVLKSALEKINFSDSYRVEVLQCSDGEVAYSYEINKEIEKTIIPCAGRFLPKTCYTIQVQFLDESKSKKYLFFYILIPLILAFIYWSSYSKRKKTYIENTNSGNHKTLGSFIFYPEQNKLVKQAKEIALSKKECELLEIFIANANQVIKREELTKRVWEDNGVIVGRSLDTYISKLRKKLKDDESIKLKNIHGVGYKLTIE